MRLGSRMEELDVHVVSLLASGACRQLMLALPKSHAVCFHELE